MQLRALAAHWSSLDTASSFSDVEEMIPTLSAGTNDAGRAAHALTGAVMQRYAGLMQSSGLRHIAGPMLASAKEERGASDAAADVAAAAAVAAQLPLYITTWEASGVPPPPPPPSGVGRAAHRSVAVGSWSRLTRHGGASRLVGAQTSAVMSAAQAVVTAGVSAPGAVRLNTAEAAIAPLSGPDFAGSAAILYAVAWGVLRVLSAEARSVVCGGIDAAAVAAGSAAAAAAAEVTSGAQTVRGGIVHQGTLVR